MADPQQPQQIPQIPTDHPLSVFNQWVAVQNDPDWKGLSKNDQADLRDYFWNKKVVGNSQVRQYFQQNPEHAAVAHHMFFDPAQQELDAEAAKHAGRLTAQPIFDVSKMLGVEKPGIAKGVTDTLSGLTSVENIGLMGLMGPLAGGVETGLGRAGVAAATAARTTRTLQGLASAGFTADMLRGAYQQYPEFKDALDKAHEAELHGNPEAEQYYSGLARQKATEVALSAGLSVATGRHAASELRSGISGRATVHESAALKELGYTPEQIQGLPLDGVKQILAQRIRMSTSPTPDASQQPGPMPGAVPTPKRAKAAKAPTPVNAPEDLIDQIQKNADSLTPDQKQRVVAKATELTKPQEAQAPAPVEAAPFEAVNKDSSVVTSPEAAQETAAPEQPDVRRTQTPRSVEPQPIPSLEAQKPSVENRAGQPVLNTEGTNQASEKPSRDQRFETAAQSYVQSSTRRAELERRLAAGRFLKNETPEQVKQRITDLRNSEVSAMRVIGQYGSETDVKGAIEKIESSMLNSVTKAKEAGNLLGNDARSALLVDRLKTKGITSDEKNRIRQQLGMEETKDFRVFNKSIKNPELLQNIKDTQEGIRARLDQENLDPSERRTLLRMLYAPDGTRRNVALVSKWAHPEPKFSKKTIDGTKDSSGNPYKYTTSDNTSRVDPDHVGALLGKGKWNLSHDQLVDKLKNFALSERDKASHNNRLRQALYESKGWLEPAAEGGRQIKEQYKTDLAKRITEVSKLGDQIPEKPPIEAVPQLAAKPKVAERAPKVAAKAEPVAPKPVEPVKATPQSPVSPELRQQLRDNETVLKMGGHAEAIPVLRNYIQERVDLSPADAASLYHKALDKYIEVAGSEEPKKALSAAYDIIRPNEALKQFSISEIQRLKEARAAERTKPQESVPTSGTKPAEPQPVQAPAKPEVAPKVEAPKAPESRPADNLSYEQIYKYASQWKEPGRVSGEVRDWVMRQTGATNLKGIQRWLEKNDPSGALKQTRRENVSNIIEMKKGEVNTAPEGIAQGAWDSINSALRDVARQFGVPASMLKDKRDELIKEYQSGVAKGDPMALANVLKRIKGVSDGSPADYRKSYDRAQTLLSKQAKEAIDSISTEEGIEYRGSEWGLAWFHDQKTDSTLAMRLADAKTPEAVRAHLYASRAEFAKGAALKASGQGAPVSQHLANLPNTFYRMVSYLPRPLQSIFNMSDEKVARTVAAHTDPMLHEFSGLFDTDVVGFNRLELHPRGDFVGKYTELDGAYKTIGIAARGGVERFLQSLGNGFDTMNDVLAHEAGHMIFHSAVAERPYMRTFVTRLEKIFPDAVDNIRDKYAAIGKATRPGSFRDANELFSESFMHYYKGLPGNHGAFKDILRTMLAKNPDRLEQALKLEGQGREFQPGGSNPRMIDIAWGKLSGYPNDGMPLQNPIRALGNIVARGGISAEDKTKAIIRDRYGRMGADKDRLFNDLESWVKKYDSFGPAALKDWYDRMEGKVAGPLSAEEQQVKDTLRNILDDRRDAIHSLDPTKFEHFLDNYFPHVFEKNTFGRAVRNAFGTKRPLASRQGWMKSRYYEYMSDALDAGAVPSTYNPIRMSMMVAHEMDRYLAAHQVKADLKNEGMIKFIRDAARNGVKQIPQGWVKLDDRIFQSYRRGADHELIYNGAHYAPPEVAKIINNFLSPGLRGNLAYDTFRQFGNTLNQVQLGMSAFHLTTEALNASISDAALGLDKLTQRSPLDAAKLMGRAFIPFYSGLHAYRLGSMLREEHLSPGAHPALTDLVSQMERSNFRFQQDPYYKNSAMESFWRAWKAKEWGKAGLRTLPAAIEYSSRWLMDHVVPRMKSGVAAQMMSSKMNELVGRGVTDRFEVANEMNKIADSVDNRMGQISYDNLFWNKSMKDIGMLSFRSLGWNLGTVREIGGGLKDLATNVARRATGQRTELTSRSAYALALPLVAGWYGAMVGYANGQKPQDLVDYFYPKTGNLDAGGQPERLSIPTYMRDIFAVSHAPGQTLMHKLHPIFEWAYELYKNEDYYGREIRHPDDPLLVQAGSILKHYGIPLYSEGFRPISVSSGLEHLRSGASPLQSFMSGASGITPAPKWVGQSRAEELAYDLAVRRMPQGPRTTREFEHQQTFTKFRNDMVTGKLKDSDLQSALTSGKLSTDDVERMLEETQMSPLERHVSRLPLHEALQVFDKATPSERARLRAILVDKVDTIGSYSPQDIPEIERRFQEAMK